MYSILKICGAAIISVVLAQVLKNRGSSLSGHLSEITGVTILISVIASLSPLISFVRELITGTEGSSDVIPLLMTVVAIAIVCQTVCDICKDNGENTLSSVVEFAGNAEIILLSLPIIKKLLDTAFGAMAI